MLEKIMKYVPQSLKANKICRRLYQAFVYCISFRLRIKKYLYYEHNSFRIKKFKDIHKGQRCFIIGTGPSLNQTNLSLIKDEIIFGVNILYRRLSELGIGCDYYAVSDGITWQGVSKDILASDTILFIGEWPGGMRLNEISIFQIFRKSEPIPIKSFSIPMYSSGYFSKDVSRGVYPGGSVVITLCLQLAYYMGFKEVYLLGCDSDYSGLKYFCGPADVVADESQQRQLVNPSSVYFTNDWSKAFESYKVCKKVYEEDGREIINATVGGKLEIFKRKRLEEIILSGE